MMVVLTFHVGALTYFNTLKCSHASLHPGKAGSCKQPLSLCLFWSLSRFTEHNSSRFAKTCLSSLGGTDNNSEGSKSSTHYLSDTNRAFARNVESVQCIA